MKKNSRKGQSIPLVEIWNTNAYIAGDIVPRLKAFKDYTVNYPLDFKNGDEWDKALDKMIYAFELISECKTHSDDKQKDIKEGFELFCKYFFQLWD